MMMKKMKPDKKGIPAIHQTKVTSPCRRMVQNRKVNTVCQASCGNCYIGLMNHV
jgi:hypothetical protein